MWSAGRETTTGWGRWRAGSPVRALLDTNFGAKPTLRLKRAPLRSMTYDVGTLMGAIVVATEHTTVTGR